jgi:uncharacterized protein (TIGR03437 family)
VADFNGDGKADLAMLISNGTLDILLGQGDGKFSTAGTFRVNASAALAQVFPVSIVTGDFNRDGKSDIAVISTNFSIGPSFSDPSQALTVFLGNGDGTFGPASYYPAGFDSIGGNSTTFVAADFNGDGVTDLVFGTNPSGANPPGSVNVMLGNGDGIFKPAVKYAVTGPPSSLAVGDFNEDGKPDIAASVAVTGQAIEIELLLGNGDGTFRPNTGFNLPGSDLGTIAVEDFNGDGHGDLVFASRVTGNVTILAGRGDGTFTADTTVPAGSTLTQPFAGDLNGDGRADVIVANLRDIDFSVLLATSSFALVVQEPSHLPGGVAGVPYSFTLTAAGGTPPYTNWRVTAGALPAGLTLSSAGTISGTPVSSTGNPFGFSISVMDNLGLSSPALAVSIAVAAPVPAFATNGIAPAYGYPPGRIEPGSWVSLYGTNLASRTASWNGEFPKSLGGVTVTIDDKPAYLSYVSPTQINLEAPDDTAIFTRNVSVVVTNEYGSTSANVLLQSVSPSIFRLNGGAYAAAVIPTNDGSGAFGNGTYDLMGPAGVFAFPTRPVKQGETLMIYGTGFGSTSPAVPAGVPFSGAANATASVDFTIGGIPATALFAGVVSPGLFQFNVTVPKTGPGTKVLTVGFSGESFAGSVSGIFIAVQ